ncbi:MAG: RNA polymerase sigma factor [Clostridia bacterium]|nr:RNA polymerase sigma factor [Clostridia bacterium]
MKTNEKTAILKKGDLQSQSEYTPDTALLAIKCGDENAFEYIYNYAKNAVFYCAYSILKDRGLAEDIMQNTFMKVRQYAYSYQKGTKPLAWITTIARNLSINEHNKRKREVYTDFTDYSMRSASYTMSDDKLVLDSAFKCLKEKDRQIVIMHVLGGLKHRELAEIFGMPLGTVLFKYNSALKKLRKYITEGKNEKK